MPSAPVNDSDESRNSQWAAFLQRWPLEKLATMTLREYTEAGNPDCFVYWLEVKTEGLASVWGGSAFKFGIYSRRAQGEPKRDDDRYYGETYAWYARYGDTPEAAFERVRENLVQVANAARRGDLEAIDDVGIGQVVKWKLAFLYQDRQHPTVLPILKLEYLQIALGSKLRKTSALQRGLMAQAGSQDVFGYADAVWAKVEPHIKTELTVEEARSFFDQSDRFTAVKPAAQKMAGYSTARGQQIALALDNRKTTLYLGAGDWLASVQSQLQEVDHYASSRTRSSNLAANAPALAEGNAIVRVVVPNMEALIALCDAYESPEEPRTNGHALGNPIAFDSMPPLNQILFGPPGTGKTYETINAALEVLSPEFLAVHREDRAALKARFDALVDSGDIRFVTFHQSFSYEDFVEGIRAEQTNDGQLSYSVIDGVFKSICLAAQGREPLFGSESAATGAPFQVGERFGSGYQVTHASADILELKKPNGNGLGFSMRMLELLANFVHQDLITIEDIREKQVFERLRDSTLEPYIVNGYNNILPALVERVLARQAPTPVPPEKALKPTRAAKVLIIDEINRGNVSRVLGELITLIEPSKRAGCAEALEVTLPYSKDRFSVPPNLYLIGTMNTADRSLAGLDLALRRRFSFREMPPRPELLEEVDIAGINIGALLRVMNERIELLLDRDHCIGHAYFMPLVESPALDALAQVFRAKILPLLQEYFFEDWQRIQWVFNDHRKSIEHRFVHKPASNVAQLFGEGVGIAEQNQRWMINEQAFSQAKAYIGVINHLGVAEA